MEEDKVLYWKHFKIWILGILISFPITGILGYLFKENDPDLIIPILIAIFFLPLVFHSVYGIRHGYCMSRRYGYIHRGKIAKFWNVFDLILYIGVVLLVIVVGGGKFS